MLPEEARSTEARPWFIRAIHDLRAAEVLFFASPPLAGEAAYHCQQAVEKALKGFLTWHDIPFGKTHDLAVLGGLCARQDPSLETLCVGAEHLSVYAWAFRYPGDPEEPDLADVSEAINIARRAIDVVLSRLPPDARPPSSGGAAPPPNKLP
jgi:HEPN domain-containing protein